VCAATEAATRRAGNCREATQKAGAALAPLHHTPIVAVTTKTGPAILKPRAARRARRLSSSKHCRAASSLVLVAARRLRAVVRAWRVDIAANITRRASPNTSAGEHEDPAPRVLLRRQVFVEKRTAICSEPRLRGELGLRL
jgi:hypothetical protein